MESLLKESINEHIAVNYCISVPRMMIVYVKFLISLYAVGCLVVESSAAILENIHGNNSSHSLSLDPSVSSPPNISESFEKPSRKLELFWQKTHQDAVLNAGQLNDDLAKGSAEGNKEFKINVREVQNNFDNDLSEFFSRNYRKTKHGLTAHRRVENNFIDDREAGNNLEYKRSNINNASEKTSVKFTAEFVQKTNSHIKNKNTANDFNIRGINSRKIVDENKRSETKIKKKIERKEYFNTDNITDKNRSDQNNRRDENSVQEDDNIEKHLSIGETNFFLGSRMENNSNVLLPPNVTGLCPEPGPQNGLDPCTCTNNGGSLGGTINIFCPPEVSSQAILKDIIQRTTFFTTDVDRFTLVMSEIGGVFNMDMFLPLTVRELNMNNDRFQSVDNHAFNASANFLISISLANNDISYFHFGAVSSEEAPYLQYLNISGNDLQFLPQDAFVNPQLESVSISNNRIYTISQHCFSGLINSRLIDVSSNYLSDLQSNSFSIAGHSTSSVLQINMSNNSIRYIPVQEGSAAGSGGQEVLLMAGVSCLRATTSCGRKPDVFGDLIDVYVNLSDNLLTELDEAVFRPIIVNSKFFAYFQVDGNPIKCNCDIFWIVNNSQIMECFDNFHCAASDQTLYQLTPQDMPEC